MQPFRQPQPPPRDPEVDTSELEQLAKRKHRRARIMFVSIVVVIFLAPAFVFGLLKGQAAWETYRWKAGQAERDRLAEERARAEDERERARLVEIAKHTVSLAPADHERAARALDAAEQRAQKHVDALGSGWLDLVTHAVTPSRANANCPVDVPAPDLAAKGALSDVTNVDQSQDAQVSWVYVDGRKEPAAKELAKKAAAIIGRSPDLDAVRGLVPISPPPQPSYARAVVAKVRALRIALGRPMLDTDHAEFVRRTEALAAAPDGGSRRYDYFAVVDVWFVPQESGDKKFIGGDVVAHSFVWDAVEDRPVCAGVAIAESSRVVEARTVDLRTLHRDLRLQLERELASSMRAAVTPVRRAAPR